MSTFEVIEGEKGGKGGGGSSRTPREAPNTLRSTSKARIIDALCEGPIVGLANGLQSIYLDETPLQDEGGTYNFQGVTVHTRDGEPDQAHIAGFPAVETAHDVSVEVLADTPVVRTVGNLDADAVRVTVQIPALTFQNKENGDLLGTSVTIAVDVRPNGGTWAERKYDIIEGKTTSPYQRTYRIDLTGVGPWDVRVRRITADSDAATLRNQTYWATYTEVIDAKLQYPDTALVGLEVDAQQFGNQIPKRSYDIKGMIVRVPSNYDPATRTYSGLWDGSFKLAWSDNPAWCFLDLATNERYGAGLKSVDKWALYQIAQYSDALVPNGYGQDEPRFTFNTVLSSREEAISVLNTLASAFRGMTYWGANTVMPVADMPGDPVKLVTAANVVNGEFEYSGTALKARHSVALVSWNDPNDNYRLQVEVVEDADAIQQLGWKQLDVTAVACTSRGQAHRLGKWMLASERAETETVTYAAGVDHADVRPGDIIALSDPTTAGARLGGRIVATGLQTLELDQVPESASGSDWYLDVLLPSGGIERREVGMFDGNSVTLVTPLSAEPITGAIWLLSSQSVEPRQFRVLSVAEQEAGVYQVTALEHDPTKYARIEHGLSLPEPDYSLIPTGPVVAPYNISVEGYTYIAGGTEHQGLTISWTPSDDARVTSYIAEVQGPNDVKFSTRYTGEGTSFDILDVASGEWRVRVRGVTGTGTVSPWALLTTQVTALLMPQAATSVEYEAATFSITLRPRGGRAGQQWEFWRSSAALTEAQIESNAVKLGVANQMTDTGLRSATLYYYYVRGINVYGVSSWYPLQVATDADFSDIFGAIQDDIEAEGTLYDAMVNGVEPAAVQAAENAVAPFRQQLDANTETVGELITADDEQSIKLLLIKAADQTNRAVLNVEQTVRANIARQVTTLETGQSSLRQTLQTVETEQGSQAQALTQLQTAQASVEDNLYTFWDPATDSFTSTAIRTVDVGGKKAILGMRSNGEMSEIGAIAGRFYIYNEVSGEMVLAFVVEGGRVVMPEALIGKVNVNKLVTDTGETLIEGGKVKTKFLAADELTVQQVISPVNASNGRPTFALRKNGSFELNGSNSGGRTQQDGSGMRVYDSNGTLRVRLGVF